MLHRLAFEAATVLVVPPSAVHHNGAMIAWAGAERLALGLTDTRCRTRALAAVEVTAAAAPAAALSPGHTRRRRPGRLDR